MRHIHTFESHARFSASVNEEITKGDLKAMGLAAAMGLGSMGASGKAMPGRDTLSTPPPVGQSIDSSAGTGVKKDTLAKKEAEKIARLPKDTQKQLDWLREYVMSDMYLLRLKKEFPGKSDEFIRKERQARYDNLKDMEFRTKFVKSIGSIPGMVAGYYDPKVSMGERRVRYDKPTPKPVYLWKKEKDMPTDAGARPGQVTLETEYGKGKKKPAPGFEHIPAHEFSHAIDDGGVRIPDKTMNLIHKLTEPVRGTPSWRKAQGKPEFEYEITPTEFVARMQAVRYLLAKKGIYDATKQNFSEKHFKKMMEDPDAREDNHLKELLQVIKGDGAEQMRNFIQLMNSIAKNDAGQKADTRNYVMTPAEWRKVDMEQQARAADLARKAADGQVKVGGKAPSRVARNLGIV